MQPKILLQEILKGVDHRSIPTDHKNNLDILLVRINQVRQIYGKPMIVTSGYRSMEDHLRIYREKGITDKSKIPMKSRHLIGAAVDILDSKRELQTWVKTNESAILNIGLWCEHFDYTKNWVHFQCVPYGSWTKGKSIFFIP